MTIKIKTSPHTTLAFCSDCNTTHVGMVPCGMTYADRLRTVRLDSDWMPTRRHDRSLGKARGGKDYYDDQALSSMFGGSSAQERHDELMEETKGVGVVSPDELAKYPELVDAHYLRDPDDEQ